MTRKQSELIADAIATVERAAAECYAKPSDAAIASAVLQTVTDEIGAAIAKHHPRFDRARFEVQSMPLRAEEQKRLILASLERGAR